MSIKPLAPGRSFSGTESIDTRMILALLLCVSALPTNAATLRVGPSLAAGCTHTSLGSALSEAAANADATNQIRLANSMSHVGVRIVLNNAKGLSIEGGYDSCTDPTSDPSTPTTLQALAGDSLARVSLDGGPGLSLTSLVLQGGVATNGGGIQILSGTVSLDNVQVRNNQAIVGGGVSLVGGGAQPSLLRIGVNARPSFIFSNTATSDSAGLGGGVYCGNGGTISFVSGGIADNNARFGGGIFLEDGCRLQFDGQQPASPPVIRNNIAQVDGGAIYAADAQVSTSDNTRIFIDGNRARSGSAVFAQEGADVALRYAWIKANTSTDLLGASIDASGPNTLVVLRGGPLHVRCENGEFCSQLNGAGTAAVAVISVGDARVEIDRVHLTRYTAVAATPTLISRTASIRIASSLVTGNQNTAGIFLASSAGRVLVDYSTIVANTVPAVFINENSTPPQGEVTLHASVIFNTAPVAPVGNFVNFLNGPCRSLVNENANADGVGTVGVSSGLDADFVPFFNTGSAIDACPIDPLFPLDMAGNPRPYDAPVTDLLGPMDRGAFERQAEPPLFRNGFE